jgi:hypothetical protein
MLHYLHLQPYLPMHTFACRMVSAGNFNVLPGQDITLDAVCLLDLVTLS